MRKWAQDPKGRNRQRDNITKSLPDRLDSLHKPLFERGTPVYNGQDYIFWRTKKDDLATLMTFFTRPLDHFPEEQHIREHFMTCFLGFLMEVIKQAVALIFPPRWKPRYGAAGYYEPSLPFAGHRLHFRSIPIPGLDLSGKRCQSFRRLGTLRF